jgi:small subunit ribosomal protein S23
MTRDKAYDIVRQEFYAIRHAEDVERMVAKEEALSTGSYFSKSMLEIGMELEDRAYESWKDWAVKEVEAIEQQKQAGYQNTAAKTEDDSATIPATDEDLVDLEAGGSTPA